MRNKTARAVVAASVVALTSALAGCSGGGRTYAVPDKVCGVPVKKSALSPLLPDGKKVWEKPARSVDSNRGCDVVVDKRVAFSVYES